jgi:hypothetical protein
MRPDTLKLKRPFGYALLWTTLFLALLFVALELFLRAAPVQPYLVGLNPSLGGRHLQMEEQLARLERYANQVGQVDCIFLGSSLVWLGFNPATFEAAFYKQSGQDIHCFNLGVETLPANAASALAEVVVAKYRPWLLIYGTSARDYAISPEVEDSRVVLETPWLRYQLGERGPLPWLLGNSLVLRYLRELGGLIRFDEKAWNHWRNEDVSQGFLAKTMPPQEIHFQAAARDAARWLQPYSILPANLDGLARIAQQEAGGSEVVVIEMPVSLDYVDYFAHGQVDYNRFVAQVGGRIAATEATFLSPAPGLIPDEGWWDKSHMNVIGADIFSAWLAGRIVALLEAGELVPLELGGVE